MLNTRFINAYVTDEVVWEPSDVFIPIHIFKKIEFFTQQRRRLIFE